MTLIVLATAGLLACAFYIYVLCQWMLEANGKRTLRPPFDGQSDGTHQNKRPYIMVSRNIAERNRSDKSPQRASRMTGPRNSLLPPLHPGQVDKSNIENREEQEGNRMRVGVAIHLVGAEGGEHEDRKRVGP